MGVAEQVRKSDAFRGGASSFPKCLWGIYVPSSVGTRDKMRQTVVPPGDHRPAVGIVLGWGL